ncbi:copper resistance CopC family protein [Corynebacterium halotolerans]|uniref:copper resistance CopC family protein n=1 Tax=Corynebacterium halotolerans TaxID=225326 RepID=UPI003CEA67EA
MSHTRVRPTSRAPIAAIAAAGVALAAGALGFGLPQAQAHDSVIGGTPEPGSVVEEFPEEIVLEFSGIPQDTFNTMAVSDTDSGEVLFSGEPELDERLVSLDVPDDVEAGAGNYTVGFQITSSDGHATRGSINFEVAGGSAAGTDATAETPADDGAQQGADTSDPEDQLLAGPLGWVFGGVGVIVILGVLVMMIAKNRNNSEE